MMRTPGGCAGGPTLVTVLLTAHRRCVRMLTALLPAACVVLAMTGNGW